MKRGKEQQNFINFIKMFNLQQNVIEWYVTKGGFDMSEKGKLTLQIFYPRDRGSVYKRLKSDLAKHSYNTVTKFNKFIYENNN